MEVIGDALKPAETINREDQGRDARGLNLEGYKFLLVWEGVMVKSVTRYR